MEPGDLVCPALRIKAPALSAVGTVPHAWVPSWFLPGLRVLLLTPREVLFLWSLKLWTLAPACPLKLLDLECLSYPS